MESRRGDPSSQSAAEQLRNYEALRDRAEHHGPSRAFALLLLWSAVVMSAYVGVFLFSFGSRTVENVATTTGGYTYSNLLVLPILIFSGLISGARDRFSIRKKPSLGQWVSYGLLLVGFMTLAALSIVGVTYPWWLNLLVAVALFVTMAAGPLRRLRRSTRDADSEQWMNQPLTGPVRGATILVGVVLGLLVAISTQVWFPIAAGAIMMLALMVALIGWRSLWGLPRAGYEWGPIHWAAFGIAMGVLFVLTVLLSRTGWITTPLSIAAGVLVFLVLAFTSFLPLQAQRR